MLERHLNTPLTSSAGRLFDAAASLAGVRQRVSYEGQAAIELEWLAATVTPDGAYPFEIMTTKDDSLMVDTRPLIRALANDSTRGIERAVIARRFHATMTDLIVAVCSRLRDAIGLDRVVLSGGVFMNTLLLTEAMSRLEAEQFRVYRHRLAPPNDGGLSLGQLAIAAAVSSRRP
jgi:hydrogenase maturation protein HypF